jgi:hypothetical protein
LGGVCPDKVPGLREFREFREFTGLACTLELGWAIFIGFDLGLIKG